MIEKASALTFAVKSAMILPGIVLGIFLNRRRAGDGLGCNGVIASKTGNMFKYLLDQILSWLRTANLVGMWIPIKAIDTENDKSLMNEKSQERQSIYR